MKSWKSAILVGAVLLLGSLLPSQDCPLGPFEEVTDDFYFTASSDQGAVGDVVAVDISLTIERLHGFHMTGFKALGCYDGSKAELLGQPIYSDFFDRLTPVASEFVSLPPEEGTTTRLFKLQGVTNNDVLSKNFPSAEPRLLATVFFRLKGQAGDVSKVEFCDFRRGLGCIRSWLLFVLDNPRRVLSAFSTRHAAGTLRVLPGDPTRPDPPALPPSAKVYPAPPTPETATIYFQLTGAVARPGDLDVPLSLYVTSNFEFSGFAVSLTFDPRYLQLASLEEHTRPSAVKLDKEKGQLGMYTSGTRRMGAEGERVKIATLHFSVKEEASEVAEATPKLEPFGPYLNWLEIRYAAGAGAETVPVTAEVTPLLVQSGVLKIQRRPTSPGDVDLSYEVDLSDAVALLGDLFLGTEEVMCMAAADFNADGAVNISDPIAILRYLFLGGPAAEARDVYCTPGG